MIWFQGFVEKEYFDIDEVVLFLIVLRVEGLFWDVEMMFDQFSLLD